MSSANSRVDLAAISQRRVLDRRGKPLGRIMGLFLDMADGRVEYATLRLQSDKPNGCRHLVIPWSQFGISSDGEHLELDISRTVLESVASRHPPKLPESH
jgi:sporulation protein YlmC with PRC-barrel domain